MLDKIEEFYDKHFKLISFIVTVLLIVGLYF